MHYEKFADGTVKCIEEEIPFELPERWEWCRLGVITEIYGRIGFRGYTKDDLVEIGEGAITLSPSNIINSKLDFSSCTYISWVKYDESPEIQLAKNDIVLVKTGSSYGKSAIVDKLPEKTTLNPQFVVLKNTKINSSYACMYLQSTHSQNLFREFVVGTAIPTFSQKALSTLLISCPPISEQHRIVEKLNELLSFVDTIESDKTDLQKIIQQTKSKILDLAIRGKLVPQDPNDEPASVLLERIRTEKEELIKQGKIKRDKKESVIFKGEDNSYYEKYHDGKLHCLDNELPFELPEGWEWCRGINCFSKMQSKKPTGELFKYIDIDSIDNNKQQLNKAKIISVNNAPSRASRAVFSGSVLFSLVRPYLKNIALIDEGNADCIASTGFYICTSNGLLNSQFLYFLMISPYVVDGLNQFMKGDNSPSISKDDVEKWLYPIPPIEEQKAIASKIAALFSYLDSIAELLD